MTALICLIVFLSVAALFALDDLFVDAVAIIRGLKPKDLNANEVATARGLDERWIAVTIANWHEAGVLEHMVNGNIAALEYSNYMIFLGVYPNDEETLLEAERLATRHKNVQVVINPRPGPTSKGQMLNEIYSEIIRREETLGAQFDLFLLQDTEDVIHPFSFKLINSVAANADFIQIPIFSLDVPPSSFVAGTYVDEFTELHTKDLLVREYLGAAIPSAGVGTAVSRGFVLRTMARQEGVFLNEKILTEDYLLGMTAHEMGLRSRFVCATMMGADQKREFIATREHFPREFKPSVRQRTRWTLGIAFQGARLVAMKGGLGHRYFLWRDRRGPMNFVIVFLGWVLFAWLLYRHYVVGSVPVEFSMPLVTALLYFDLGAVFVRFAMKIRSVSMVHGWKIAFGVPVRWLVANVIYSYSTARAFVQYQRSRLTGVDPKWSKTTHEVPEHFKQPPPSDGPTI